MMLSNQDLKTLTDIGISAALKAGSLIALYGDQNYSINYKKISADKDNDVIGGSSQASQIVTEVDIKSQEVILNELKESIEKYDLGLLTEELADDNSRFVKDYFWCIDPLDGTLPFTEGVEGYSVSIALVSKNGASVIGIIYDPKNDVLYHAITGGGAFKNHLPIFLKEAKEKDPFYLITDRSFVRHRDFREIELMLKQKAVQAGYNGLEVIKDGGAAMNAMWVLGKTGACYFKFAKEEQGGGSLWDFAASTCIFTESGNYVSAMDENPIPLNKSNSTFMNDCGVIFSHNPKVAGWIKDIEKKLKR